jgi:NADPH-dependent glutamate synthase beta subunit-like oxidoreductase
MNSPSSPVWTKGTTEVYHTGTWRNSIPDYINPPSPCHTACPVGGNIALWIQQVKEKDYHAAWLTLTRNNPYPAIAGRICHHPCEPACNRKKYDEAISICGLERFVGDMALKENWSFPAVPITKREKVAIVGGGPAGLTAAFHLRQAGYAVTIFETKEKLGGLLRYGIPSYRLGKDILDKETQRILELGIDVQTNSSINSQQDYKALQKEYDAVYLATGAAKAKRLPILDYEKDWAIDSAEYLALTNSGEAVDTGQRVVVIGGGSAAMDVARTARRFDKEIIMLTLEPETELPCQEEEVLESKEEGITLINAAMLQSVTDNGDQGLLLNCIKIEFIKGDERGQFSLSEIKGSEFTLEADSIVSSIGQDPDLNELGKMLESNGSLIKINDKQETSIDGVFAGGDAASMERFVTHAFGMGKDVAREIDNYLHPDTPQDNKKRINRYLQEERTAQSRDSAMDVNMEVINTYYYDHLARENQEIVSVAERLTNFNETQLNFSIEAALKEVDRCFSCGNCIFCDNCVYYCPDMAITKTEQGYEVNDDFCKGCGLCVSECPTGSIKMFEDK